MSLPTFTDGKPVTPRAINRISEAFTERRASRPAAVVGMQFDKLQEADGVTNYLLWDAVLHDNAGICSRDSDDVLTVPEDGLYVFGMCASLQVPEDALIRYYAHLQPGTFVHLGDDTGIANVAASHSASIHLRLTEGTALRFAIQQFHTSNVSLQAITDVFATSGWLFKVAD